MVLVLMTLLLGAEHEDTLVSANILARSLSQCGRNVEAVQVSRGSLALSRRVLGPTHRREQKFLRNLRAVGPTVR